MKHRPHNAPLDAEALRDVRKLLDCEVTQLRAIVGGTENRHFLVETQNYAYVLSLLDKRDADAAERYANYVTFLFEHDIPIPRIHPFATGRLTTTINGVPAILSTFIQGEILRPFPVERLVDVGGVLGKLHTLRFEGGPKPHIRFSEKDFHRVPAGWFREWLTQSYTASYKFISASRPHMACHCDLFPDNIILSTSGQLVLIDWEDGGEELPVIDMAMAILGLCCRRTFMPDAANALLKAYARAVGHSIDLDDLRQALIYCATFVALTRYLRRTQHQDGKTRVRPYRQMPRLLQEILSRWVEVRTG